MSEESNSDRVISGRYRLLEQIGRGGMGIVWRARDEVLARDVAVKEVRAPAGIEPAELRRMYRRLEREAWAAARVTHRGVVTVYDVASEDGRPWIVMELVRGLTLADVLEAEGPLTPQRAAHLGEQVLAALRSAHDSGVLHRDVKPGNVLIANDGRVVLSDFGIASLEGSSAITMTGEVVGSPEFVAPERVLGRDPGPESDLWSLGIMLYAAVEGVSPFRRATACGHAAGRGGRGVAAASPGRAAGARTGGAAAQGPGRAAVRDGGHPDAAGGGRGRDRTGLGRAGVRAGLADGRRASSSPPAGVAAVAVRGTHAAGTGACVGAGPGAGARRGAPPGPGRGGAHGRDRGAAAGAGRAGVAAAEGP